MTARLCRLTTLQSLDGYPPGVIFPSLLIADHLSWSWLRTTLIAIYIDQRYVENH